MGDGQIGDGMRCVSENDAVRVGGGLPLTLALSPKGARGFVAGGSASLEFEQAIFCRSGCELLKKIYEQL